jgi:hypothetical protein
MKTSALLSTLFLALSASAVPQFGRNRGGNNNNNNGGNNNNNNGGNNVSVVLVLVHESLKTEMDPVT